MRISNPLLDSLSRGHDRILVFDCEFWHVLGGEGFITVPNQPIEFFFLPREFGGFLLTKQKDGWDYEGSFHVTLSKPKLEVAFPISHYATVTGPTGYKLDELEHSLGRPWGEAFPSMLSAEGLKAYKEGIKVYENDPIIKKSHKPNSWYKSFLKLMQKSLVVVKGTGDLNAIQNACTLYGYEYTPPAEIVDIAQWNQQSYKQCRTAKLEGTFQCIEKKVQDDAGNGRTLRDILPLGKAHDPSVDASMTLLVAMYIESKKASIKSSQMSR